MPTERRPAVLVNGKVRPLPAGDTVKGVATTVMLDARVPDGSSELAPTTKFLRADGTYAAIEGTGTDNSLAFAIALG